MKIELIFIHLLHWAWINLQSCFLNSQKNDFHKVQGVPLNIQGTGCTIKHAEINKVQGVPLNMQKLT